MSTTRDLTISLLLIFGIVFLLTLTFLQCEIPDSRNTLTGKVEWMATDEDNQITVVAIATQTGDYLVGDDTKGRELLRVVNKKVNVRGKVIENENGQKTVYVSKYQLVPQ
jgi:hypothetical protein